MKAIVYLPLFTSLLLVGWYLFAPASDPQPAPAAAVFSGDRPLANPLPGDLSTRSTLPSAAPEQWPSSVRGTDVDGQLEVDARGNLVITSQIRHLFDYFLSLIGEEDAHTSEQRIRHYLAEQLKPPAQEQALALLDNYLAYQQQLTELESRFPVSETLDDLLAREQAVQQLRARRFSREAHEAFFAGEEIYNNFTLERLNIARDELLDEQQKALAVEALRENLPQEMQQLLVPQIQQELNQQTLALREAGADDQSIRELRLGMLGPDATERLESLDQQRAHWRQRVDAFEQEREMILAQPGLAEADRQAAVNALLDEQFTAAERLRLHN